MTFPFQQIRENISMRLAESESESHNYIVECSLSQTL